MQQEKLLLWMKWICSKDGATIPDSRLTKMATSGIHGMRLNQDKFMTKYQYYYTKI